MKEKKIYFVLDTVNKKNGLHYPVIMPTINDINTATAKMSAWIGPRHYLENFSLVYTKKNARAICENMRKDYKDAGLLEFEGAESFETL